MSWFERITGIREESPVQVREGLELTGDLLRCPNGSVVRCGQLLVPTLNELRDKVASSSCSSGRSRISEWVADVRDLHAEAGNKDALFQVASQFNLLEMTSPSVTPEQGVGVYEHDHTQGPACAIACGAGTIYRNYYVPLDGTTGQSTGNQIDCASMLGEALGNTDGSLWSMENGYLFPTDLGLQSISARLQLASEAELNELRGSLQIGLQRDTEVTLPGVEHCVSQAYCSALPVAYGRQQEDQWADFAKLVLESAYEATFAAAVLNRLQTGVNKVYLTLLGGGVFGNRDEWITGAIERAFLMYRDQSLDVMIVSHGGHNPVVADLISRL